MNADQAALLFSLLALGALGLAVGVGAMLRRGRHAPWRTDVTPLLLPAAFAVAATSMAGSLYFSEIAEYTPCELCWFQRIAMYPLALILGIAALRRDHTIARYVVPVAAIGAVISIYHYQLQVFPDQGSSCDQSAPCTARWVEEFGFVSIPFMALCGFLAVIALTTAASVWSAGDGATETTGVDDTDAADDSPEGALV